MINSGLIFETLVYSVVEAGFLKDESRSKLYYDIIKKHYTPDSPLYTEAVIFNTLLNISEDAYEGDLIEDLMDRVPTIEEVKGYYNSLLRDLNNKKVLQEIEDTFKNLDDSYNNVFSLIDYAIESARASTLKENTKLLDRLRKYTKRERVHLIEKNNIFSDKMVLFSMIRNNDLTPDQEEFVLEIFASDNPVSEFLSEKYDGIYEDIQKKSEVLKELGSFGKVAVSAAVLGLIVKKLSDIKNAIERSSKETIRTLKGLKLEHIDPYLDYKELLEEMESIIDACKEEE